MVNPRLLEPTTSATFGHTGYDNDFINGVSGASAGLVHEVEGMARPAREGRLPLTLRGPCASSCAPSSSAIR